MPESTVEHKRKLSIKMQKREFSREEELIKRKWIVYSGGKDSAENPLLTFHLPATSPGQCQKCWSADDLIRLLCHMIDMVELMTSRKSAAFLLPLQNGCSDQKMTLIIQALQSLEADRKGTVAVLYIIKPNISTKRKLLKKLLGIKRTKEANYITCFKTVIANTLIELHSQIDQSQLSTDFGGKMPYDHEAWVHLHRSILPCIAVGEDVFERVQDVRDKVHLLREYDLHEKSSDQLIRLRDELQEKYLTLIRESDLSSATEMCKQALHAMELRSVDHKYDSLYQPMVASLEAHIRTLFTSLIHTHNEMNGIWATLERHVTEEITFKQTHEEAEQVTMDITEYFWPSMSRHPQLADNLHQAKAYRRDFTAKIYEPAKELLHKATIILQQLQSWHNSERVVKSNIIDIVNRLTKSIHPFAARLNVINKTYASIHAHFLLYNKAAIWYNKTIEFIPKSLFQHGFISQSKTSFQQAPKGWRQATRKFLQENPAPKEDLLHSLDSCAENNLSSSRNTKILVSRIRMLVTLLYETYLDKTILRNVQRWKEEPLFEVTENSFENPLSCKVSTSRYSPSLSAHQGDTRLRRRISRTKSMRPKLTNQYNPRLDFQKTEVRRVLSSETGSFRKEPSLKERFVSLSNENLLRGSSFQNGFEESFPFEIVLNLSRDHPYAGDSNDLDGVVDYINSVTGSQMLSNSKKLQYVSDALSLVDLKSHETDELPFDQNHNHYYGADDFQRGGPYDNGGRAESTSADAIAEMTDRLWKSLDDVSLHDADKHPEDTNNSEAVSGSLNELATKQKEQNLWKEVEKLQPFLSSETLKSGSKGSLGTCDADVSSRSNDDTDDIDDASPMLRRDRPSRQNIRRKRRSISDLAEVNIDEALSRQRLGRRHSERTPSSFLRIQRKNDRPSINERLYRQAEKKEEQAKSTDSLPHDSRRSHGDVYSSSDMGYQSSPSDTKGTSSRNNEVDNSDNVQVC